MEEQNTLNVTPELSGFCKTACAVFTCNPPALAGSFQEDCWLQAPEFSDFTAYPEGGASPEVRTSFRMLYDQEYLYLAVTAYDRRENIRAVKESGGKLWQGDVVEIFFADTEPVPYILQFALGPGGGRYANDGDLDSWKSQVRIQEDSWRIEMKIPMAHLHFHNFMTSFNIARRRVVSGKYTVWQPVGIDLYTTARYGKLIRGPFSRAAEALFGIISSGDMSRQDFETLLAARKLPANQLTHGPWLFDLSKDEVSIGWQTAGDCLAQLEYRRRGTENFQVIRTNLQFQAWSSAKLHQVQITGLAPGCEYEYRIRTFPTGKKESQTTPWQSFRTFSENENTFSFAMFSDLHNSAGNLKKLLKQASVEKCRFLVNAGDMLNNSTGSESIYDAYIDAECALHPGMPLFNVRGNHEFRGNAPGSFFRIFPSRTALPYGSVRIGKNLLIFTDAGDYDTAEVTLVSEENRWLKNLTESPDWKTAQRHIMICHVPILSSRHKETPVMEKMLDGVFLGKNPLARLDLMLCGHTHEPSFTPADSGRMEVFLANGDSEFEEVQKVPFPIICNDGPGSRGGECSMLLADFTPDALTVSIVDMNGSVIRSFRFP